jgi:hypothetical protein
MLSVYASNFILPDFSASRAGNLAGLPKDVATQQGPVILINAPYLSMAHAFHVFSAAIQCSLF